MSICSFARVGLAFLHEATVRPGPGRPGATDRLADELVSLLDRA
jgi:hypothetical protein